MRHDKAQILIDLGRRLASSAEGMTLDEMAAAAGVGRRSAERLRDALQALFPQMEEYADGPSKRFRIPGGLDAFLQAPTTEELLTLTKAAEALRASGGVARAADLERLALKIRSAMRRAVLNKVMPDLEALVRAELIAVQAGPRPVEKAEVLGQLREALMAMKALRFVYHGGRTPGATREVTPYGLMFGRVNYLVAAELGDTAPKSWRLDRLEQIELLPRAAAAPDDFSLAAFANKSFGMYHGDHEAVVLRVKPHGVDPDFHSWRFHSDQTVEARPDGSMIVRFAASGMRELAWHLFSWGDKIEIIAPVSLRELMVQELKTALAAHAAPARAR